MKSKAKTAAMMPATNPVMIKRASIVAIALGMAGIGMYIFLIVLWINDHASDQDSVGLPILILFGCFFISASIYVLHLGIRKLALARDIKNDSFSIRVNDETVNLGAMLFLIPVGFGETSEKTVERDYELHFSKHDSEMYKNGALLFYRDLPKQFAPAKIPKPELMHYQTLVSPIDGRRYMPLFTSYKAMTSIYGENISVGVISFRTARDFVLRENFAGIVFAPGVFDEIIPTEKLPKWKEH